MNVLTNQKREFLLHSSPAHSVDRMFNAQLKEYGQHKKVKKKRMKRSQPHWLAWHEQQCHTYPES